MFYNRQHVSLVLRRRVFNFYDSPDFHQYSFAAHKQKMMHLRVWASYKYTLKKFILHYCKQQMLARENTEQLRLSGGSLDDYTVYYYSKIKVPSVAPSWGLEVGIDSNWNVIKFGACSVSLKAMRNSFDENVLHDVFLNPLENLKIEGD